LLSSCLGESITESAFSATLAMFFVYRPQASSPAYLDPQQAYAAYRRRDYVAALEEEQQRIQFELEIAREEERHRKALAAIAQQQIARRERPASLRSTPRRPHQHTSGACDCGGNAEECIHPDPQEIFRRRQSRQQEEERLSRDFHRNILTQMFGIPSEQIPYSTAQGPDIVPPSSILTQDKDSSKEPKGASYPPIKEPDAQYAPEGEPTEPHWSAAPERARSLAEITSISRAFTSLKNTFVFPSGPLERMPDSDAPQLAYNPTNTSIHAYQHALSDLLSKLDTIESYGFKGLRQARKQLIVKIEEEMDQLEKKIRERLSIPSTTEAVTVSSSEPKSIETSDTNGSVPLVPTPVPENSAATDVPQQMEHEIPQASEDVTMGDILVDHPNSGATNSLPVVDIQPETQDAQSNTETAILPEPEPLDSQETSKEATDVGLPTSTDTNKTSVATTSVASHTASPPPKKSTISVEDDDSEVDDAVKTCNLT
jgi:hypothetical protein